MRVDSLPLPLPTPPADIGWLHGMRGLLDAAATVFRHEDDNAANARFALDPASARITDEHADQWNTTYTLSGSMRVSVDGTASVDMPVRYDVTLRNTDATPERMRQINPFDPATLPERTRITINGGDYTGTPLEAGFAAMADANGVRDIHDLRLSLDMLDDGTLRVMTGAHALFDAPRAHGPASLPGDRQDFIRHTTLLHDPAGGDSADYNAMLLTGAMPPGTVRIEEAVNGDAIHGEVSDTATGEINDVTWTLDAKGRPVAAEAELTWEPGSGGRDSDRIEVSAQSRFRTDNGLGGTQDDVGHMVAYRFVNGHGSVNMFPQFGLFNRGAYARMEQEWSDWITAGMDVRISVDLTPADAARPTQVHVDYEVFDPASGKMIYDPALIAFGNSAGQTFDPVAATRMAEMIDTANS